MKIRKRNLNCPSDFFNLAKEAARHSTYGSIRIGAIVALGRKVVSFGFNSRKTHPIQKRLNRYRFGKHFYFDDGEIHAETMAIISAAKQNIDVSKCSIYVFRLDSLAEGKSGMCRPCAACMELLRRNKVREVNYTTAHEFRTEVIV